MPAASAGPVAGSEAPPDTPQTAAEKLAAIRAKKEAVAKKRALLEGKYDAADAAAASSAQPPAQTAAAPAAAAAPAVANATPSHEASVHVAARPAPHASAPLAAPAAAPTAARSRDPSPARPTAELTRLQEECAKLRAEDDKLRAEVSRLQSALATASLQQQQASASSSSASSAASAAMAEAVAEAQRRLEDVSRELTKERSDRRAVEDKLAQAEDAQDRARQDTAQAQQAAQALEAKLLAATARASEMEAKAAAAEQATEKARAAERAAAQALKEAAGKEDSSKAVEELNAALEQVSLQKELMEARAEELELELAAAKDRIELLEVDKEIYLAEKAEQEAAGAAGAGVSPAAPAGSSELASLKAQNEQLVVTLAKLRDAAQETQRKARADVAVAKEETEKERKKALEFQVALDESRSLAELVESLTEQNLALGAKLEAREAEIAGLEELRALSEEEEAINAEAAEQSRLAAFEARARAADLEAELSRARASLADSETTIGRFRDAVKALQTQLIAAQQANALVQEQQSGLGKRAQEIMSENLTLASRAAAVSAARLDGLVAECVAESARDEARAVRACLPAAMFESELAAIEARVLVRRCIAKAEIAVDVAARELVGQGAAPEEGDRSLADPASLSRVLAEATHPGRELTDSQALSLDLAVVLPAVAYVLRVAEQALESPDEETFRKVVGLRRHFAQTETVLDACLAAAHTNSVAKGTVDMARAEVDRLGPVGDSLVASVPAWRPMQHALDSAGRACAQLVSRSRAVGALFAGLGDDAASGPGSAALASFAELCAKTHAACRSLARFLQGKALRANPIVRKKLAACNEAHHAASRALTSVAEALQGIPPSSATRDALVAEAAASLSRGEASAAGQVGAIAETVAELETLASTGAMGDKSGAAAGDKPASAWDGLAAARAASLAEAASLKERLEDALEKLRAKTRAAQQLETQVADASVRCETLERKMAEARARGDLAEQSAKQVEKLLANKKTFEDALDELQKDNLALEKENRELKDKLRHAAPRKATVDDAAAHGPGGLGLGGPAAAAAPGAGLGAGAAHAASSASSTSLAAQHGSHSSSKLLHSHGAAGSGVALHTSAEAVEALAEAARLREALRAAQASRAASIAASAARSLADLTPLSLLAPSLGPLVRPARPNAALEAAGLQLSRVRSALQHVREAAAGSVVPLLSALPAERLAPADAMRRVERVAMEVAGEARRVATAPTKPGAFASAPGVAPASADAGARLVSKVVLGVPAAALSQGQGCSVKVAADADQLKRLHGIFSC